MDDATRERSRPPIRSYEDLEVYQRAMQLMRRVHRIARDLPDYEKFDLAQQIRRASKSVPANIAEGYAKKRSAADFRRYLAMAMGSANEMVVHFKIGQELEYFTPQMAGTVTAEYEILGKQLNRLIQAWRTIESVTPTSNL